MVDEKDFKKGFEYDEDFIKKFIDDYLGLFRVFDPNTNETIGLYNNRWEAEKQTWTGQVRVGVLLKITYK